MIDEPPEKLESKPQSVRYRVSGLPIGGSSLSVGLRLCCYVRQRPTAGTGVVLQGPAVAAGG